MPPESLLDAVSAAIDNNGETPEPTPTPEEDAPEGDVPEGDVPAGDAPEGDAPEGDKPEGETPEEKKPEGEKPVAGKPVEGAAPKKPMDIVNDPIDPRVSERTRERITGLVARVKELEPQLKESRELFTAVADTGVTGENFALTLDALRNFNSTNVEDKRKAYTFLQSQADFLAAQIGETPRGADPLAGHQDLADAVGALQLTKEHAAEIAQARNRQGVEKTTRERSEAEFTQHTQAQQAAQADLNELGATLKATDPNYAKKVGPLIEKLQPIFAKTHPSKWVAMFQKEYRELPATAVESDIGTQVATTTKQGPQPLRANKQPSGEGKKQPGSLLDAINAGLDEAARR